RRLPDDRHAQALVAHRPVDATRGPRRALSHDLFLNFDYRAGWLGLAAPTKRLTEEQQAATHEECETGEAELGIRAGTGSGETATHAVGAAAGAITGSRSCRRAASAIARSRSRRAAATAAIGVLVADGQGARAAATACATAGAAASAASCRCVAGGAEAPNRERQAADTAGGPAAVTARTAACA